MYMGSKTVNECCVCVTTDSKPSTKEASDTKGGSQVPHKCLVIFFHEYFENAQKWHCCVEVTRREAA
jgi:hypothetical protein